MILFINALITNERLTHHARDRGFLNNPPRIDVYKYMLESLAVIPYWSKAVFHVQLSEEFQDREQRLKDYTINLFGTKTSYHTNRIEYQNDWRKQLEEVLDDPDPLVWFLCNDDHIFTDYDLSSVESALNILDAQKGMASFFFSHYPEALKAVAHQKHMIADKNLFYYDGGNVDSIQLVTKKVLHRWFFENEDTNRHMPRPDWKTGFVKTDLTRHYVPKKECCRHFEGYPMVNINVNHCPPLNIPPGFFENNIQIAYGHEQNPDPDKWVLFNPQITNYSIVDKKGTDYKLTLDDIPLFWKKRIKAIDYQCQNHEEMVQARDDSVWMIANSRPNQPEYVIDRQLVMEVAGRCRNR